MGTAIYISSYGIIRHIFRAHLLHTFVVTIFRCRVNVAYHRRLDREVIGGRCPRYLMFQECTHVVFTVLLQQYR